MVYTHPCSLGGGVYTTRVAWEEAYIPPGYLRVCTIPTRVLRVCTIPTRVAWEECIPTRVAWEECIPTMCLG